MPVEVADEVKQLWLAGIGAVEAALNEYVHPGPDTSIAGLRERLDLAFNRYEEGSSALENALGLDRDDDAGGEPIDPAVSEAVPRGHLSTKSS